MITLQRRYPSQKTCQSSHLQNIPFVDLQTICIAGLTHIHHFSPGCYQTITRSLTVLATACQCNSLATVFRIISRSAKTQVLAAAAGQRDAAEKRLKTLERLLIRADPASTPHQVRVAPLHSVCCNASV